ncbi:MAG: DNA-directed RNA polymerase subunit beta [Harvfovirus sp.]|uniref:DNA-directed RNA polymerase n=1 Tax=Harvfovirus sp. TaxID=2487768 RepID=A0A3G5A511_9VIRU|nr:MAG: DNA-directed RNA polymerase subunit beta [Harvfovirus sp.]
MIDVLRTSLDECKNEKGLKILTQEDALEYLMTKMRVIKKYSETDKNVRQQQKRLHLKTLLETGFIPHVENDMMQKAVYICYMLNKLLRCSIGRIPKDDRDSYVNKRIDLPGSLIEELFRQFYRKMINDCNKFFKKRNPNDEDPINIINQIKPNVIEQGLKTALLTGSWIRRKGVAQMLQRLTFLYTMSSLRRIDAPGGDAATNKLTGPRHLHPSSVRWLCCVSTPEHSKVGLTKHLSLIGTVSILQTSQLALIKSFLKKKLTNIQDIAAHKLKNQTKVFLNGEWLGLTSEPFVLDAELRQNKLNGNFDPTVSIVNDIMERELKVYCDGGRGYAPAICVENNVIKLTKEHLKAISLDRSKTDKITSWDEFMIKYPGVVEYIDMEEQPFLLFADKIATVEDMRKQMISSIDKVKFVKSNKNENRYDDMMFVRYTHCEFHPAFLIAEIVSTIPFCNSNQGPRNIFFYSQGRQAMGIYISNYRDRLDISYILYHPQRPLVMTRTSKYTYADILPSGENVIVAIACYTGLILAHVISKNMASPS